MANRIVKWLKDRDTLRESQLWVTIFSFYLDFFSLSFALSARGGGGGVLNK